MRYTTLALKNLLRRPIRSLLSVTGVALAVSAAVSLGGFNLGYREAITRSVDKLGFQVMVMAKGCPYEAATMMLKGGTGLLYLPANTYQVLKSDPEIASITPIFVGIAQKDGSGIRDEDSARSFSILSGIDVGSFQEMKPWLNFKTGRGFDGGHWFDPKAVDQVVMGYEAAEYEQRKVGDTFFASIIPNGATEPVMHSYHVVGVLERTGTQDDGTVFLPIAAAQAAFARKDSLTIVGVKLKNLSGPALREFEGRWLKLPEVQVVSLEQVKGTLVSLIGTAQAMVGAVAIIAILVAGMGVINTILTSVHERTGEIGVMKALGAYNSDIFALIWLETLAVCVAGSLVGSVLAVVSTGVVDMGIRHIIDLGLSGSLVLITWRMVAGALAGAAALGVLAGLYPAWRAASMAPMRAIYEAE